MKTFILSSLIIPSAIVTSFTSIGNFRSKGIPSCNQTPVNTAPTIQPRKITSLLEAEGRNKYSEAKKVLPPMLLSLCILSAISVPASLATTGKSDPINYQGDYADPFHPYCERHIKVASGGESFHYSGTAVGPKGDTVLRGCSENEQKLFGSRNGAFDGLIIEAGAKITAGDGIHEGVWEPANTNKAAQKYADVDGIRWDDGNKWVKLASPSDVLTFPDTYQEAKQNLFKEGGKWFFVAYVAVSLAAGAKEMGGRLQNWIANKQ